LVEARALTGVKLTIDAHGTGFQWGPSPHFQRSMLTKILC